MSDLSAKCHFLAVPREIRFAIYRMLLLPHHLLSIVPADSEVDDWTDIDSDDDDVDSISEGSSFSGNSNDADDGSDNGTDGDRSLDSSLDAGAREYMKREEANHSADMTDTSSRRYPAILSTNRQIHDEASSLLYSEGILAIEAADIFALAENPYQLDFGVPAEGIWSYHPLGNPAQVQQDGTVRYSTEEMGGKMYPHVFARFQRIRFDASFDFSHTQNIELWIDEKTHVLRAKDADRFQKILRESTVMKDFVKLISQSSLITKLEIYLEVEVIANSNLMIDDDADDSDPFEEQENKMDRLMDVSNERATELFLDSGICDMLFELDNVRKFEFNISFSEREEDEKYEPLPKHVRMLKEMKSTIEGNFKDQHA